jgi:hypothetical protein
MVICLKIWGIVNEDVKGEDIKKSKEIKIIDQEKVYFVL